jgi:hypothetical protein
MLHRPPHSPSRVELKAARGQRYRQRLRAGEICPRVVIGRDVLGLLVQLGYLLERDAADLEKIGDAASMALRSAVTR